MSISKAQQIVQANRFIEALFASRLSIQYYNKNGTAQLQQKKLSPSCPHH